MKVLNLDGCKELLRDGWRDVNDADRCYSLGITPATGTLYRRLRDVLNNSNALIDEIERLRRTQSTASEVAARIRQNCTVPSHLSAPNADAIVYAVADWIEDPPEWVDAPWRS